MKEWETVEYVESMGEVVFPEGFAQTLIGLSIEEQANRYRTTSRHVRGMIDWKERMATWGGVRLELDSKVRALIVRDGIVVGVMLCNDNGKLSACLSGECVCTYYDCENNGAGEKVRIDYTYLICRAPEAPQ